MHHDDARHDVQAAGWPLMQYLSLENMVSVVDAEGFTELFSSDARMADRPELGEEAPQEEGPARSKCRLEEATALNPPPPGARGFGPGLLRRHALAAQAPEAARGAAF